MTSNLPWELLGSASCVNRSTLIQKSFTMSEYCFI